MVDTLVHSNSMTCMKSELDLFSVPPTQTSILDQTTVEFQPISTLTDDGPIEFFISGTGSDQYIDPSQILLHVRCQVLSPDGGRLAEDAVVAPECNLLHSLWSNVDMALNDTYITSSGNTYAQQAYIETLLTQSQEAVNTHLQTQFWHRDTKEVNSTNSADNPGFARRRARAKLSKHIDLLGRLHLDFCKQGKLLMNNVNVKIRLVRNSDAFVLRAPDRDTAYRLHLLDVNLLVRKCKINPNVLGAHLKWHQEGHVKYPLKRLITKVFSEPAQSLQINKENLFLGQLPSRVVIGFLNNNAMHGTYTESPFNFQHFDTNYICLHLDGRSIPAKPLRPDFDNECYARSYYQLQDSLGKTDTPDSNTITYKEYAKGHTLWVFDLTPDAAADSPNYINLIKHGNLRLEVHFKKPLDNTISVLVQGEFTNLIEIDKFKNVMIDFTQ